MKRSWIKKIHQNDLLVLNTDNLWQQQFAQEIKSAWDFFQNNQNIDNLLLSNTKSDFHDLEILHDQSIKFPSSQCNAQFQGCHFIRQGVLEDYPEIFNIPSYWNKCSEEKKLFSGSWKHKRCLIPASGFFEKKYLVRKANYETFWLGGIWSKWTSSDGAELESCCVLTTDPNDLIKPLHHRMPVIVPNGYEEQWTEQVKDADELKGLFAIMMSWSSDGWLVEDVKKKETDQMSLF